MTRVRLFDVCHARAGDKGDDALLVLVPYRSGDLPVLAGLVTPGSVARHFHMASSECVSVKRADNLNSLVIAVRGRLYGGVTRSLTTDPHGKTLSGHLLDMVVEWPDGASENPPEASPQGDGRESGR